MLSLRLSCVVLLLALPLAAQRFVKPAAAPLAVDRAAQTPLLSTPPAGVG